MALYYKRRVSKRPRRKWELNDKTFWRIIAVLFLITVVILWFTYKHYMG